MFPALWQRGARGRKGGRPKALTPKKAQQLRTLYNDKTNTIDEICRTLDISRATSDFEALGNPGKGFC
jgi:DNA invertase Pin-like site-specific DNA recombinase